MKMIFTIGTQGMNDNLFISLLQTNEVDLVMDVRLRNEGWCYGFASGQHIKALAETHGMTYRHDIRLAPTDDMLN